MNFEVKVILLFRWALSYCLGSGTHPTNSDLTAKESLARRSKEQCYSIWRNTCSRPAAITKAELKRLKSRIGEA